MYIQWQIKKNKPYAYLRESYWDKEKKAPRTRALYLGCTLLEAIQNLEKHFTADNLNFPQNEQEKLYQQLHETAPVSASEPRLDIALEKTIKLLSNLISKQKDRPDIVGPLKEALEALQAIKR